MAEGIDMAIADLKMQLSEIKQRISQCRKRGADAKIAELRIMSIPAKIKTAEATQSLSDISKISAMIENANREVGEMENQTFNEKKENSKTQLEKIFELIDKMEQSIKQNSVQEAKENYTKCYSLYKNLIREDKKEVFKKLSDLRIKISA